MKVSSIANRTDGKITRSNEFNHVNLYETIPINVAMGKIQDNNEIAEKFVAKQRVIKETSSIGGFRMSKDKLKKREDSKVNNANESLGIFPFNPNEENYPNYRDSNYSTINYKTNSQYGKFNQGNFMNSNSINPNAITNANSYNMSTNFNNSGKYNTNNFSKNFASEIDFKSLNPQEDLSTNLMSILEKEVEKLKKESEEFKKIQAANRFGKSYTGEQVQEEKVITNYLCTKDDRMQAIKHVTTQDKPEYMSLEELQKMKEENAKRLLEIENEYYQQKLKAEQRAKNVDDFINRDENKKISIEEINEILRNEEDYFQKDFGFGKNNKNKFIDVDDNGKIQKRKFIKRPKSTKNIRRFAEKELDKPLNRNEEKYVKKYVEYVMKKKKFSNPNEDSADDQEDWNKTKILSHHVKGGVNRNDGLSGHLYNDDYSFYYLSINSENTPKSLSLKSFKTPKNSTSKTKNKKFSRKSNEKHLKKNYQLTEDSTVNCNYKLSNDKMFRKSLNKKYQTENSKISNNNINNNETQNERLPTFNNNNTNNASVNQKSNKSNMNSHLAFGKLIFQLLDKNKSGSVAKVELLKELELDENILVDLGFESQEDLVQKLQEFKSEKEGYLDEQEFIAFLLSRSDLNEEYLENYRNNNADGNMHEENNYDFDAAADMENIDNKYYRGEEVQFFESDNQILKNRHNTDGNSNNIQLNEEEKISNIKLIVKSELEKEKLEKERESSKTNFEFLNFNSTGERLSKLRDTLAKNAALNQSANISRSNANIQQDTDNTNYKSQNIGDFNSRLTKSLKKRIHRQENLNTSHSKTNLKAKDAKNIKISYRDYTDFVNRYKVSRKSELNFTIPKPFPFMQKDYNQRKLRKMEEILEERKRKEDEILGYRFRANEVKKEIFISQFENIIEEEKYKRKERTQRLKEKIVQEMKPFTFYENDEKKYKEKIARVSEPPQFLPFKANPVPWTSQVNLYEDLVKKSTDIRKRKVEERARETLNNAKLPPRMEMHEKRKKQLEEETKIMEQENKKKNRCQSGFKAKEVPDFAKKQEEFIKNLERKKSVVKPTEPVPFTFHEPKKKASLRAYLDKENDPQAKSPNFKRNIVDIIHKLQQKPKIEPASNKSLTLLMAARRNELEEKQRMEEKKILEDKMRKEKQERLKERVVSSKALADNKEMLESKRRAQQEAFKKGLIDNKKNYEEELARRVQRVYNKPLMFETSYKSTDKVAKNRNLHQKVYGELSNNDNNESYNDNNNYNYSNNEEIVNESELKQNVSNKISNLKEEDEEYEDKFDDV